MLASRNLKSDLAVVGLLLSTVLLALCLLAFDPLDPPSTALHPPRLEPHNLGGVVGAWVAHLIFSAVGIGAYWLLGSAIWLVAHLLGKPVPGPTSSGEPVLRTVGWLLSLVGLCTLAALALPPIVEIPLVGAGGALGAMGRALLLTQFAALGAGLLTLSCLFAGLLLLNDQMVLLALHWVGWKPWHWLWQRYHHTAPAVETKLSDESLTKSSQTDDLRVPTPIKRKGALVEPAATIAETEPGALALPVTPEVPAALVPVATKSSEPAKAEANEERPQLKVNKPSAKSEREAEIQQIDAAAKQHSKPLDDYELPSLELLLPGTEVSYEKHEADVRRKAQILEQTFANFGFNVRVVEIDTGPVIAQFEVELEAGLRLSKITSLADDLAIALRVPSVRIVAPIPGKNTVGIEVPNAERQLVRIREVIEEAEASTRKMRIPIYLGKDVSGQPLVFDLTTMPHLLIAGRTGTGKSVCLNTLIVSMLMTRRPDEVKMLLIDPKMVELSSYKKIPHLMHPVVTDMKKAEAILAWAVEKMEERYALLARAGVRHIGVYNQLGRDEILHRLQPENDEQAAEIPDHLPYIVIVADEMADLMMTSAKEVETHIIRLAQKSRAVGIHLVLATQKPTVDVITGLIKSNLPARISFQVASRVDSRVVLDEMGADKLLGNGDMLFLWPGTSTLLRGQGTYITDEEINAVVDSVSTGEPQYVSELVKLKPKGEESGPMGIPKNRDELYEAAIEVVIREGRGSVSLLQRALGIGYGRAARLVDYMAEDQIVGDYNGSQAREVLYTIEQWEAMRQPGSDDGPVKPLPANSPLLAPRSSPKASSPRAAAPQGGTATLPPPAKDLWAEADETEDFSTDESDLEDGDLEDSDLDDDDLEDEPADDLDEE